MNHIHSIYIYVILVFVLFSCKPSSKINSEEVQSIISNIKKYNDKNDFNKSFQCLKLLDSVYNKDIGVKKKYLELLKETNKFNTEYLLKSYSDSLKQINDSIDIYLDKYDLTKIDDKDRGECYYLSSSNKVKNNNADFVVKLNEDATIEILSSLTIENKTKIYNSVSVVNGVDQWISPFVEEDNSDNYTYKLGNSYVETVRFSVPDFNKFMDVINCDSKLSLIFYGKDKKIIKSRVFNNLEIKLMRNICLMQDIISRQFYYIYMIDNTKKRLLKSM